MNNFKNLIKYIALIGLFGICNITVSQEKRDLLSSVLENQRSSSLNFRIQESYQPEKVSQILKNLPEGVKESILKDAVNALDYTWPVIPVTTYLDFKRTGNRVVMEQYYNQRNATLKALILGEMLEKKGRFIDAIINACWAICEQSTWVLSAHLPSQKGGAGIPNINEPIIDLGAGEISSLLAWTYHLFKDEFLKVSPYLKERIPQEIKERIIIPYLERDDFWWMAFKKDAFVNNWNPWCNYNVLLSTVLLDNELDIDTKRKVTIKSMQSVDKFINYYKDDGACEEGPAYWSHAGGKLLEYLNLLLKISDDKFSLQNNKLIENMGTFIMNSHIEGNYYVNFADSAVRLKPNPGIVYRFGVYTSKEDLKQFGSYLAKKQDFYSNPIQGSIDQVLNNLLILGEIKLTPSIKKSSLFYEYKETEIVGGRTSEEPNKGFFFAAKGGYNDESHNHNDVGSFILYYNGEPLIVDAGVGTYTKKTFSKHRYDIWTMQSDYHNLPKVNGQSQAYGKNYKASGIKIKNTRNLLSFSLDLSRAYPEDAACNYWKRSYNLKRSEKPQLTIVDQFSLKANKGSSRQHLLTFSKPLLEADGVVKLTHNRQKNIYLKFSNEKFNLNVEELDLKDKRLEQAWKQNKLYRLVITPKEQKKEDEWTLKIYEE